ncbi:hypothetical protein M427DRAFT_432304 [Gonapodya prolifera JEL478]|uniref:SH3 domain-containing protein n=1 Tax=Gonapodya prolifera (strain JEL478) TaxID=1344416 RepID=A0A139AT15_GONPJ|nr:hypothetical protein M427DRAFT_432304 [Gonapodya prolifera JEL478]|eukprot:KXS19876.1 hypothetical protein M427DRAFT_432304 [Gonapodya prolifera JEL478]
MSASDQPSNLLLSPPVIVAVSFAALALLLAALGVYFLIRARTIAARGYRLDRGDDTPTPDWGSEKKRAPGSGGIRALARALSQRSFARHVNHARATTPAANWRSFTPYVPESQDSAPPEPEIADRAFVARHPDEVSVSAGQRVLIYGAYPDGWALGRVLDNSRVGFFPLAVLEPAPGELSIMDGGRTQWPPERTSSAGDGWMVDFWGAG